MHYKPAQPGCDQLPRRSLLLSSAASSQLLWLWFNVVAVLALLLGPLTATAQIRVWNVGDRVEAGPNGYHPATVLAVSPAKVSFRLHYEDNAHPDDWVEGYWIRPRNTQAKADALAANGPRLGKYLIYVYATSFGAYNGYFLLQPGGNYQLFLPGGKSAGGGTYAFDRATATVKWQTGPFASKDWDGTQKLIVEREGKGYTIWLKNRTIGSNSSD
ncbi:hypothetical protein [Hymenobacter sp. BRD67]|uniref:hypothetical protein n=1 Tax=Hymenobacter sp. BRD67 TaxID=2675877 RepID=UPI0015633998|nr:hypothetical protein [Hymenobacter sp. BRD67]QKG51784.1 hypothetical protein GKZ67_03200 [Hymenobacter sp. BRD67]